MPITQEIADLIGSPFVPAYVFDVELGRIIDANQLFCGLVGYSQSELLELDWRQLVVPDEHSLAERAIDSGAVSKAVRWRFIRKDGCTISLPIANRRIELAQEDGTAREMILAMIFYTTDTPPTASEALE
jgi:PAS domain S-box-containing protein